MNSSLCVVIIVMPMNSDSSCEIINEKTLHGVSDQRKLGSAVRLSTEEETDLTAVPLAVCAGFVSYAILICLRVCVR